MNIHVIYSIRPYSYIFILYNRKFSIVVRNGHLARSDRVCLLVGRRGRDISRQVRNTAGSDVGIELRGELEKDDDGQRRVDIHLDGCEGSADGAGEIATVKQGLLRSRVVVDCFPACIGFCQAVLLAENPGTAVLCLHVVRRANGGVAHAILHVSVVPHDRGVAEVDLVAGAGVLAGDGTIEGDTRVELDGLACWDTYTCGARVESGCWRARVFCDIVGHFASRGIDDGYEWVVGAPRTWNASITLGADCAYAESQGREEVGGAHFGEIRIYAG